MNFERLTTQSLFLLSLFFLTFFFISVCRIITFTSKAKRTDINPDSIYEIAGALSEEIQDGSLKIGGSRLPREAQTC